MLKIRKKKTSGYAIFCSEFRRRYANENPELQFADISKKVAEDWRLCEESVRKEYEEKAQRYNAEEEKRWRQKVYMHQQQQMHLQVSVQIISMRRKRSVVTLRRRNAGARRSTCTSNSRCIYR
jgi:hypothetical protein